MSLNRMHSVISLVFFGICGIGFFILAFSGGGVEAFADDSARHVGSAAFIFLGMFATPLAHWIMRRRRPDEAAIVDERDERVRAKAMMPTLMATAMLMFAAAFGLWEHYQEAGVVPVGWMWVLAYGTMIAVNVLAPAFVLLTDIRGWADGR